jgi:hypothetical protein
MLPTLPDQSVQTKTVQRRMYDAINILAALGLIHKDRKQLYFVGNDKINGVTLSLHRVTMSSVTVQRHQGKHCNQKSNFK